MKIFSPILRLKNIVLYVPHCFFLIKASNNSYRNSVSWAMVTNDSADSFPQHWFYFFGKFSQEWDDESLFELCFYIFEETYCFLNWLCKFTFASRVDWSLLSKYTSIVNLNTAILTNVFWRIHIHPIMDFKWWIQYQWMENWKEIKVECPYMIVPMYGYMYIKPRT